MIDKRSVSVVSTTGVTAGLRMAFHSSSYCFALALMVMVKPTKSE